MAKTRPASVSERPQTLLHRRHTTLLNELGDERRPTRLMTRAKAGAVVPVKVLVKRNEIVPMRVALEPLDPAEHGAPTVVLCEKSNESSRKLDRHLPERQRTARAHRVLD